MRAKTWALLLLFGVLMLVIVLRSDRRKRPPRTKMPAPAVSYVERPIPPETAWGPRQLADSELPPDVDEVLAAKCRRCHGSPTRNGAPFALYTWSDTRRQHNGQLVYERLGLAVKSGFMPNLIPANPPVERLTDAEKKTLLDWVAAGAPRAADTAKDAGAESKQRPRVNQAAYDQ